MVEAFVSNLPEMKAILEKEISVEIPLTFGLPIPQIGANRIKIAELIFDALKVDNDELNKAISDSNILLTLTDLFFTHHWNSQLHNIYVCIVDTILTSDCLQLKRNVLVSAELGQKILQCVAEPMVVQSSSIEIRKGQMGHVTKISNALVKCQSSSNELNTLLEEVEGWAKYIDGELNEQNELEAKAIGGKPMFSNSIDSDPMGDGAYSNDADGTGSALTMDDLETPKTWEESKSSTTKSIVNRSVTANKRLLAMDDIFGEPTP